MLVHALFRFDLIFQFKVLVIWDSDISVFCHIHQMVLNKLIWLLFFTFFSHLQLFFFKIFLTDFPKLSPLILKSLNRLKIFFHYFSIFYLLLFFLCLEINKLREIRLVFLFNLITLFLNYFFFLNTFKVLLNFHFGVSYKTLIVNLCLKIFKI
jgi:hypothetical protein